MSGLTFDFFFSFNYFFISCMKKSEHIQKVSQNKNSIDIYMKSEEMKTW